MPEGIPKWIKHFLEWTCSPKYLDELQGDLMELFSREQKRLGPQQAKKKFIRRALFSVRWYRLPEWSEINVIMLYKNHHKVALRHAIKHKSASGIHALGLIMGLIAVFYIGLFLKNELHYDQMHAHKNELYRVLRKDSETGERDHSTSSNHAKALAEAYPFIETCRFGNDPVKLGEVNPILVEDFYWSDSSFFEFFSFDFIEGNPVSCLKEVNSIVLTKSLARQIFGNQSALGQSLKVKVYDADVEFPMQVTGVVEDPPKYTHIQFKALGAMPNAEILYKDLVPIWGFSWVRTYLKVPDGRIQELISGLPQLLKRNFGDNIPMGFDMDFQAFSDVYLRSQDIPRNTFKGNYRDVQIFGSVGLLILLISLMNYINLATARSVTIAKEVGIRKVLGSQRAAIISQFIVESILFTLGSGLIAAGIVALLVPQLNDTLGLDLSLYILSWQDFALLLLGLLGLGFIAGMIPALVMAKLPGLGQAEIQFKVSEWSLTRKLFVGIQYFVALSLLVATIVIYQQYTYLKNYDLGFNPEQLISIPVEDRMLQAKMDLLKETFGSVGGVRGISATGEDLPSDLNNTWGLNWPGNDPEKQVGIDVIGVDENYFELLDIPIVKGQNFIYPFQIDSARSVILNEQAQELIGKPDLVGSPISIGSRQRKVLGIVEDHHNTSLHQDIIPIAYFIFPPGARVSPDNLLLKVETSNLPALIRDLEKTWANFSTDALSYHFVDEAFAQAYESELQFAKLISAFSIIAILISIVGLFGLIHFIVQLKLKEISIRRILGASQAQLLNLLGRDFLLVFGIATLLALPLTYYLLNDWLLNYNYRIQITAWLLLPAVIVCLGVSVIVIHGQLLRVAKVNPSEVINRS